MCDRIGGACFYAVAAEDTPVVVDVVDLSVPLGAGNPRLGRVLRGLNVDAIARACGRAQKTRNTLFQAVFIALQLVLAAETLLEHCPAQRPFAIRIVLHLGRLERLTKRDSHALRDRHRIAHNRHSYKYSPRLLSSSIYRLEQASRPVI